MTFAEKLQLLRKTNGYSQEKLAELLEVSRQSVSKWELGESMPETSKIIFLSELFDVSLDSLLKDTEELHIKNSEEEIKNTDRDYSNRLGYFKRLIKKYGYIAGFIISAYGAILLTLSQIAVYISQKMLSGFDNSFNNYFAQYPYMSGSPDIVNPVALLGNIMSIVGVIIIIIGIVIAFVLKKKK